MKTHLSKTSDQSIFSLPDSFRDVLKKICVSILWLLLITFMAEEAESQTSPDPGQIVNFQLENDLFGGGTDRHYTHGSRISMLSSEELTNFEKKFKNKVFSYLPEYFQPDTRRIGFVLGQNMFTPEDISRSDLIKEDQPYAGWLYMGVSLVAEKSSGERP
jgi:lipid A 3-O-deacylase